MQTDHCYKHYLKLTDGDAVAAAILAHADVIAAVLADGVHAIEESKAPAPVKSTAMLSVRDVAAELNVSNRTVRDLDACGKLPASRIGKGRGTLRFDPALVKQYKASASGEEKLIKSSAARRRRLLGF